VLVGSSRKHMLAKLVPTNVLLAGYAMEKKSSIIAIGLTIHNTPVEIRERLAVPEAEWPRAISELCAFPHIEEVGYACFEGPAVHHTLRWRQFVAAVAVKEYLAPEPYPADLGPNTRPGLQVPLKIALICFFWLSGGGFVDVQPDGALCCRPVVAPGRERGGGVDVPSQRHPPGDTATAHVLAS
jgi:hypothetical protein